MLALRGIILTVAHDLREVELYSTTNMAIQGRKAQCFKLFLECPQECNSFWLGLPHSCILQCPICFQAGVRKDRYHILLGIFSFFLTFWCNFHKNICRSTPDWAQGFGQTDNKGIREAGGKCGRAAVWKSVGWGNRAFLGSVLSTAELHAVDRYR